MGKVGFANRLEIDGECGHGFAKEVFDHPQIAAGVLIIIWFLWAVSFEARVVVAVYVEFPDEGDVSTVDYFDRFAEEFEESWHNLAAGPEQALAQVDHVGDHGFVEQEVAHLFVQNDVDGFAGFEIAAVGGDKFYAFNLVMLGDLSCVLENFGVVDGVDFAGTLPGGEGGEDSGACAEIDHEIAGMDVALDRGVVEIHARLVGEHFFLFAELGEIPAVEFTVVGVGAAGPVNP